MDIAEGDETRDPDAAASAAGTGVAEQYLRLTGASRIGLDMSPLLAQAVATAKVASIAASVQRSLLPTETLSKFAAISSLLDTAAISKVLAAQTALPSLAALVQPAAVVMPQMQQMLSAVAASIPKVTFDFTAIQGVLAQYAKAASTWTNLVKGIEWPRFTPFLPANLRDLHFDLEQIAVLVHEGLTVYGVPGERLTARLLAAPDRQARRAILGRELVRVADDCDVALDGCVAPETREAVKFARRAIAAARGGHVEAAQALASNALDTQMRRWFTRQEYVKFTSHKKTSAADVDEWGIRTHMALGPIWVAHEQFEPGGTALIPQTYARHATTHAVSGRQYNRRNAAQALLLLTSLVIYVNEELADS